MVARRELRRSLRDMICQRTPHILIYRFGLIRRFAFPSRHIVHTVGPIYSSSKVEEKAAQLGSCYKTSLQLAVENSLKHIVC